MSGQDATLQSGLERLKGLTFWWTGGRLDEDLAIPVGQLQSFALGIHNAYREASLRQIEKALKINQEIVAALASAATSREPNAFLTAQSRITTCLLDAAATNARAWAELGEKVQQCCAPITHKDEAKGAPEGAVTTKKPSTDLDVQTPPKRAAQR